MIRIISLSADSLCLNFSMKLISVVVGVCTNWPCLLQEHPIDSTSISWFLRLASTPKSKVFSKSSRKRNKWLNNRIKTYYHRKRKKLLRKWYLPKVGMIFKLRKLRRKRQHSTPCFSIKKSLAKLNLLVKEMLKTMILVP